MRPISMVFSAALLVPSTAALADPSPSQRVEAAAAPRADARVLRALQSGAESFRVLVGVRDGTPSARALKMSPDPEGEPARRAVRLEAQARLAAEMPAEEVQVRHFYGNFSMLSATVTRAALLTLANRPDVDWIGLDGTKRPLEPASAAQSLIHSDQANASGASGIGQTIAILDTGVDYTVAALGGGGFPNGKVVGGTDTADGDDDPMDCEGHGTSVAAVAASSAGVAPDAKIVAIKVFKSTDATNASCQDTADDSDILAGVDWAVTHRDQFGIRVINLSLGGGFDDTLDHGFCDADVPDYTMAFDAALAAGIAVVVASGNDGTSNALSAPACVSSAISVGAVYSQTAVSQSWLDDKGNVQCTDAPTAPDQIVCFSDSSTNLSLLAPGAFWIVAKKGSGVDVFAGTSASAPAVSGSLALLRQARPGLPAYALVDVLRATGKPINDARNGVTTPRVDALAAVTLPTSEFFSSPQTSPPVPIPDGTGSASASLTVSGATGGVSTLEVIVAIDHPDPQQLRLTLRSPDGTSVVLHDQTGQHEHPINAVYGLTATPQQSLDTLLGHPAAGSWRLVVEDLTADIPSHEGRILNFAVVLTAQESTSTRSLGGRASLRRHTRTLRPRSGSHAATVSGEAASESSESSAPPVLDVPLAAPERAPIPER
jgi:subtilisin family serine protease